MIKNPKETDFPRGEEGNSDEIGKVVTTKASSSTTTNANSTSWLRLKDPRIVRVSRVFGGKDRHSKVCTIRGLRDRRVRLSVPTAIQLYDLQDRLGLNQPSKVVDWLLNAAKHEIDELPPLPMPLAGNFSLLMAPREASNAANTSATASQSNDQDQGVLVKNNGDHSATIEWQLSNSNSRLARSNFWSDSAANASSDAPWRVRSKEVLPARESANDQKKNLRGTRNINQELEKQEGNDIIGNTLLQRTNMNHPFFPGMINSTTANNVPNSYHWEPPNYPLLMSHLGGSGSSSGGGLTDHNLHSLNVVSLQPSTLSLSTGSQFLLCPPGNTSTSATSTSITQTYFPNSHGLLEIHDPRQLAVNHFQMVSSNVSAQSLLPNPIPMRSLFHFGTINSTNDNGSSSQQSKEQE